MFGVPACLRGFLQTLSGLQTERAILVAGLCALQSTGHCRCLLYPGSQNFVESTNNPTDKHSTREGETMEGGAMMPMIWSAGRGLFRNGVVSFSLWKPREPRKPQDENSKTTPFQILQIPVF